MKKLLQVFSITITFFVIFSCVLIAQPNYNFSSSQGAYISIIGQPGTLTFNWRVTSSPNDEDFTFPLTIVSPTGFSNPFLYDGVPFKQIQVSCNGFLKFVDSVTGDTLSTAKTTGTTNNMKAFLRNVLAPLWDDIAVFNEAVDIVYQFAGPPGLRVLTIEWNNVKWNYSSLVVNAGFQIRFYENNGWIEYQYGAFPNAPTSPSASVGMNDGTLISGSMSAGQEATGTFLSINFGGAPGARVFHRSYGYEYSVITAGPDAVGPLPPQTTIFTFKPQVPVPMIGIYKVGGAVVPNWFARLSDAAEALNLNGVAGPVTIDLWPGPDIDPGQAPPVWDDIFHLINVVGTSVNNQITVQVDPQYGGQVTISPRNGIASTIAPSAVAGDAMIRLDGTRYTTITSGMQGLLRLVNNTQNVTTTTQCEMGILLGNAIVTTFNNQSAVTGARQNTFHKLYIDMNNSVLAQLPVPANNGGLIGIRYGTNGPNADPLQTNSFNTISDCEIVDFYRSAVYMFGFSSAVPDFGNVITGTQEPNSSKFHDAFLTKDIQDCRAIEAYDQKNLLIENTDVYNIIATALTANGVWGIRINPSATDGTSGTLIIRNCNVYNIENQLAQVAAGFAVGIEVTSPYHEGTVIIYNNQVYDIFTNGNQGNVSGILTQARCTGMQLNLGATGNSALNLYNNYIYDLRAPRSTPVAAAPNNPGVRGLDIQSASNVLTAQVYYNTIYLDGAVQPALNSLYSTCLYWANFGTSSLDLRNNILVNDMSAGLAGTGIATCLYASANSVLLRLALTTNNNLLWANVPSQFRPIAYDRNLSYQTLANYQGAVATGGLGGPRDAQAVTEFPPFIQPVNPIIGGIAQNLHLAPGALSQAESGALPVLGIATDYDLNLRSPNFPDIGADEWQGALVADVIPPQILYTPLPNQNTLLPPTLVATITDRSGIPPATPTLWLKRTIDPIWFPVPGIPGPGANDYTFPFGYPFPAPPVAVGDVVQYYIGAQDNPGNVGTNPTGGFGTPPPGLNPPAAPNTYTIVATPIAGGSYSVGLNPFNKLIGKNLYPQVFTKIVKERVRVERNLEINNAALEEQSSELKDFSLITPGIDQAYSFDVTKYSPTEFVMRDVVREYVQLMDNGKVYEGPYFISATKADLERAGINTTGVENILGVYATLTLACNDLNTRGVSGAVTLSLVDNAYNGTDTYPIELRSVAGVSAANTITIKPKVGITPVFTTTAGITGVPFLNIINTSFVTVDGSNTVGGKTRDLTFNNIRTGASQGIWIGSLGTTQVGNITIKNCKVYTGETSGSTPIMVSDGTTSGSSGYFTNIAIINNDIQKGRQGIYINGGVIPQYGSNITVEDNTLNTSGANQLKLYGIYTQGCSFVSIKNNNVGNFETATFENDRGIWLAAGSINAVVEKNIVHDLNSTTFSGTGTSAGNGGNGIVVSSSSIACNIVIKNNFIYGIKGLGASTINQNPLAIYIFGAQTGIGVYNNSIYLTGATLKTASATANAAFSCGVCVASGTYADVRNNIIYNTLGNDPTTPAGTNGAMGVFASNTLAQFTSLSNNVYIVNPALGSKSFGHINGIGYLGFNLPLASWQINSGKDANSYNADPQYVNPATGDLHISTTLGTPCESGGTPVLAVADDIDIPGDPRNPVNPDIGADEFNGTKYSLALRAFIQGFYDSAADSMLFDTVKVYLRDNASPWAFVDSSLGIMADSGLGYFKFSNVSLGTSYYLVFTHRNSLDTWSKTGGENFNVYAFDYNFTSAQTQAYGSNLNQKGTKWCIINGDVSRDNYIDGSDYLDIVNNWEADDPNHQLAGDTNGDQYIDGSDYLQIVNNWEVGASTPLPKILSKPIKELIELNKTNGL